MAVSFDRRHGDTEDGETVTPQPRRQRAESRTAILHRKTLVGNFDEFDLATGDNPASHAK